MKKFFGRDKPERVPAAAGILRALDPAYSGTPTDHVSQYDFSTKDGMRDRKLFWERKEMERDGERGRDRDRGGQEDNGQAELTRMIGVAILLSALS